MTHQIQAIQNNIIFQFTENVTQTRFVNNSASGIIISQDDGNQTLYPRWGKALYVGPDVREIKPGDFILMEQGKWTLGFLIDDVRYWKTDEDKVICTADEPGTTY